jgi:hypothetical protein
MRKDEILSITKQLEVMAQLEMQRSEQEWREKISVENSNQENKISPKEIMASSNKDGGFRITKK